MEATRKGVEEGYLTENDGQYLINGKQSPINVDAAEDESDINFGACVEDNFNIKDQQEVTQDMAQNIDNLVDINLQFSNKSEWPKTSATYFTREHTNPLFPSPELLCSLVKQIARVSGPSLLFENS